MDKDLGLRANEFFLARVREQAASVDIRTELLNKYSGPAIVCDRFSAFYAAPLERRTIAQKRYFGAYMLVDIKDIFVEGFHAAREGHALDWPVCGALPGDIVSLKTNRIEESDLGLWYAERPQYFHKKEGRFAFEFRRAHWHTTEVLASDDTEETATTRTTEQFTPLGHDSVIAPDPFTAFYELSAKRKANWGQLLKVYP